MASLIAVVRGSQQRHSGGAGATSHFRFTLVMLQVKTHPFLWQCQWCHEHEHHGLPKGDVGHLCSAVGDVQFQQGRLLRQWLLPKGCFSFLISFFSFSLKSKTNIQKIKKKQFVLLVVWGLGLISQSRRADSWSLGSISQFDRAELY